jgi:hypothetical protein
MLKNNEERPATATGCLKCLNEPAEFDSDGYSLCCRVHWELDESGDFIYKPPADPAAKRSKSSRYRGVTRVQRATVGKGGFRVQISRNGINYYLGEFDDEMDAAQVWDNAIYFLNLEGGFFRPGFTPALNFPEQYKNPAHLPAPFMATQRLLRRIRTETMCNLVRAATK